MTTALPPPDTANLKIKPITDRSDLVDFVCGEQEVDRGVPTSFEWQDLHRVRLFGAYMDGVPQAYGFYCVGITAPSPKGIDGTDIVRATEGRSFVPFIYLHYFGVRAGFQNQTIGTGLLGHFLTRCIYIVSHVGVFGAALNALTPRAERLYSRYGFACRTGSARPLMILPTQSLLDLANPPRTAASSPSTRG